MVHSDYLKKLKESPGWCTTWYKDPPPHATFIIDMWFRYLHELIIDGRPWDALESYILSRIRSILNICPKVSKYYILVNDRLNMPRNQQAKPSDKSAYISVEEWNKTKYMIGDGLILESKRMLATKWLHPTIFSFLMKKLRFIAVKIFPVELYVDGMLDNYDQYQRTRIILPLQPSPLIKFEISGLGSPGSKLAKAIATAKVQENQTHKIGESELKVMYHIYKNRAENTILVRGSNTELMIILLLNLMECLSARDGNLRVEVWLDFSSSLTKFKGINNQSMKSVENTRTISSGETIDESKNTLQPSINNNNNINNNNKPNVSDLRLSMGDSSTQNTTTTNDDEVVKEFLFLNDLWRYILTKGDKMNNFLHVFCSLLLLTGSNYVDKIPKLTVDMIWDVIDQVNPLTKDLLKHLYLDEEGPIIADLTYFHMDAILYPMVISFKENYFINFIYRLYQSHFHIEDDAPKKTSKKKKKKSSKQHKKGKKHKKRKKGEEIDSDEEINSDSEPDDAEMDCETAEEKDIRIQNFYETHIKPVHEVHSTVRRVYWQLHYALNGWRFESFFNPTDIDMQTQLSKYGWECVRVWNDLSQEYRETIVMSSRVHICVQPPNV